MIARMLLRLVHWFIGGASAEAASDRLISVLMDLQEELRHGESHK